MNTNSAYRIPIKTKLKRLFSNRSGKVNRSKTGNLAIGLIVLFLAVFSALPLVLAIGMSLKPINELYLFPPTLLPHNPTLENYKMLFGLISTSAVPFSRYIFNTVFITLATTSLHVVFASMAAYPLAKCDFFGKKFLNTAVLWSLMFVPAVADVINYTTITSLHWTDTYLAVIVPTIPATLGLFLIRNYMTTIPTTLLEAARIDGCTDFGILWKIIMPIAKPAWLTLIITMFQSVWGSSNTTYIFKESMKSLPYALSQIMSGGYIRAGAGQAVGILMLIVPSTIFIINQTKILETMASSGIKE